MGKVTGRRGSANLRLRIGFIGIAMVLSVFAGRLVQLQGIDPHGYAAMSSAENTVTVVLPAKRGEILDRNGKPLADSIDGLMIAVDPAEVEPGKAAAMAKFLANRLDLDYAQTVQRLQVEDSRFQYIARRVPATTATNAISEAEAKGFDGLFTRRDPVRDYPGHDVAANLVGFVGIDEPLAGFELNFDDFLSGTDGETSYMVGGGNQVPLGESQTTPAVDGNTLRTTIDADLQWYAQRTVAQAISQADAESGTAIIMDRKTGEVLALADAPTFDATDPQASPRADRSSRAMKDVYEPGSVQKVLTVAGLLDAGLVTPSTKLKVPGSYLSGGKAIHDWWSHDIEKLTLAGVIARSSNVGTVMAGNRYRPGQLHSYLTRFGLGQTTDIGVLGESAGIVPAASQWADWMEDRIDFGQSISVNALQMAAAVNTIANAGVRVSPSIIAGTATTNAGVKVGTDQTVRSRVISTRAAKQVGEMMQLVVKPDVGVAPAANVPGFVVAGKTGTAQRANSECQCYDGTNTVSFAGFAPAEDPKFTIYVVLQNPRNGGGGGSVAGPVFSKLMGYTLDRYGVSPGDEEWSDRPLYW